MSLRRWGGETEVGQGAAGTAVHPVVAALPSGGYVIAWVDLSVPGMLTVQLQRYEAWGTADGDELILAAPLSNPVIAPLHGGGFVVAGEVKVTEGDRDIRAWRFAASGELLGAFDIDTARLVDTAAPSMARVGTGLVVVEEINGDLLARRFNADGTPQGGEFWVTTASGPQDLAEVAELAGGGFVITWTDRNFGSLQGRVYAADGSLVGEGTLNGSSLGGNAGNAAVTGLAGGGFVSVWETNSTIYPNAAPDIRARLFGATGAPLGADFTVNATMIGDQRLPEITALRDGGFVVVWTDTNGEPSLRGQLFDSFGTRIGREFIVSTSPLPSSPVPEDVSVTELADGRLLLAWRSATEEGDRLLQQIVDPRGGIVNGTGRADVLIGHDAFADEISGFGGSDTLWGLRGGDILYGGWGHDTLHGQWGEDVLYGGAGHDLLVGGPGGDDLRGGGGFDIASYAGARTGVTAAIDGLLDGRGEAADDTFSSIEALWGSAWADWLRGNSAANSILGGNGNDTLDGGAGNDTLLGEDGNDILMGGASSDALFGGSGYDAASYASAGSRGEIRQTVASGSLRIELNADFDVAPEVVLVLTGRTAPLTAADFLF